MWKMIGVLGLSLVLSGCFFNKPQMIQPTDVTIHPDWPAPVSPYRFDWVVIVDGEKVLVGLDYNQSLDFRVFLEDMNRYIRESNSIICSYREDLKEKRCQGVD